MRLEWGCPLVPRDGGFEVGFKLPERGQSPEQGEIFGVTGHQHGTPIDMKTLKSAAFELTGLSQKLMESRLGIVDLFECCRGW